MKFLLVALLVFVCPLVAPAGQVFETSEELSRYGYVYTPTRFRCPAGYIADNVTVITSEDIEEMHAHSVAEVLETAGGMLVSYSKDFIAPSLLNIQGSEPRHVAVKLDGIPWNLLSSGQAGVNSIPVDIIDRIEIIKGPASSSWGSALGGVVNIITKEAGVTTTPRATLKGSYGERSTTDYSAQVSGLAGDLGYYAYGGNQHSNGLIGSRGFNGDDGFAKLLYNIDYGINIGLSAGFSNPESDLGNTQGTDFSAKGDDRTSFVAATFEMPIKEQFRLSLTAFRKESSITLENFTRSTDDFYRKSEFDESLTGILGQLVWRHGLHSAVLGIDYHRGKLDQDSFSRYVFQNNGAPQELSNHPDMSEWAIYTNGTFIFENLVITPGIRFDHNDITGSFISPAIGATYRFNPETLFRASISRGYSEPALSHVSGGFLFTDPNPDLEAESVWSYQLGLETSAVKYVRIKSTLFFHDLRDAHTRFHGDDPTSDNNLIVNGGTIRRRGVEFGIESLPRYHISMAANMAYTHVDDRDTDETRDIVTGNLKLKYDTPGYAKVILQGHFSRWDNPIYPSNSNNLIWDLSVSKEVPILNDRKALFFCKGRNIFNGNQPAENQDENPGRWVEAGVKFNF